MAPIRTSFPQTADASSGFSLLEVMMVLAIISLCAVIAIPAVSTTGTKSHVAVAKSFISDELGRARLSHKATIVRANIKTISLSELKFSLPSDASEQFVIEQATVEEGEPRVIVYPDGRTVGGTLVLIDAEEGRVVLIGPERSSQ